ncbi:MAG: TetR family transcriptional regulator [Gammaproteobacteria bacterium]
MARSKKTSVGADTRVALILAAERLIAENGIDGVSLRQINAEAGQRNSSAAHYHFGSKDSLVRSIYEYRLGSVNQRRQAMLDDIRAQGDEDDARRVVAAIVRPIVDEIEESEGGSFYIRFLSQAIGHPQGGQRNYFDNTLTDATSEVYTLINRALPDISDRVLGQRFGLMWEMIIHALADRERYRLRTNSGGKRESEEFINNLIDVVTGGLTAPVSAATARGRSA